MMDEDDDTGFGGCTPDSSYVFHSSPLPDSVHITPSYLGNRLFSVSPTEHFIASSGKVHHLKLSFNTVTEDISTPTIPFQSISATPISTLSHPSQITSLTVRSKDGLCLGSVDESGIAQVSYLEGGQSWRSELISAIASDGESGWCGLEFDPIHENHIYMARGFQRCMSLFDVEKKSLLRTVYCTHNPTSLTVTDEGLILMAEHNQVSVWDLRASERKG
jgi:hypothetical protein